MKRLIIPALAALALAVNPAVAEVQVNCPTKVAPVMPKLAIDNNIEGQVKALIRIDKGAVTDVTIISGPSVFHDAVRDAVLQYKCRTNSSTAVSVTQTFNFKLDTNDKKLPETPPKYVKQIDSANPIQPSMLSTISMPNNGNIEARSEISKYVDIEDLDIKSNTGKAILVLSRLGDRNGNRKILININNISYNLGIDDVEKIVLSPGNYSITIDNSGLFTNASNFIKRNLTLSQNTILDLRIAFPYNLTPLLPEIWTRRVTFDGKLVNTTLSGGQDADYAPSDNNRKAKGVLKKYIADTVLVIHAHKNQIKYENIESEISRDLSRYDMRIQLKKKNGHCRVLFYKSILIQKDYLQFYEAISEVHRYQCLDVLFDLTSRGGDGESGARIGLYVSLNGWATTTGGTPVPYEEGRCSSACTLAYFGGVKIYKGIVPIYLHQPMSRSGSCVKDESLWADFIYEYLEYVLGDAGRKVYREFMLIPCDKQLQPSDKSLKLWESTIAVKDYTKPVVQ